MQRPSQSRFDRPPCALVATDLDGTLLRSDGTISPRTRRAIQSAQAAGITVAFATARPPRAMVRLATEAGIKGLAICSNGAILHDLTSQKMLVQHELGAELAAALINEIRGRLSGVSFAVEHGSAFRQEHHFPSYFDSFEPEPVERVRCALVLCEAQTIKLLVHHPRYETERLAALVASVVGPRAAVTHSGGPLVEIGPSAISKASGLAVLCSALSVPPENVVAFGDMPNDLPMLKFAGHAVGVSNAHPDVLASVAEITASNDEDGVALVIESLTLAMGRTAEGRPAPPAELRTQRDPHVGPRRERT